MITIVNYNKFDKNLISIYVCNKKINIPNMYIHMYVYVCTYIQTTNKKKCHLCT